MFLNKPLSCYL